MPFRCRRRVTRARRRPGSERACRSDAPVCVNWERVGWGSGVGDPGSIGRVSSRAGPSAPAWAAMSAVRFQRAAHGRAVHLTGTQRTRALASPPPQVSCLKGGVLYLFIPRSTCYYCIAKMRITCGRIARPSARRRGRRRRRSSA